MKQYLLRVKIEGCPHLLHDGKFFLGGSSPEKASIIAEQNSAKIISTGGFDMVEVEVSDMQKIVGANDTGSYHILNVSGGLIPFYAVKIVDNSLCKEIVYIQPEN